MEQKTILSNIKSKLGIEQLNPLQLATMSSRSRALLILAPTGSGKTVAFAIPLLKSLGEPGGGLRGLVLAPSRELAIQIGDVLRQAGSGYKVATLYGGHDMALEQRSLTVIPDIIVATPGRLLDHIDRGSIDLSTVKALVIDEYDKSLELGFLGQMRRIGRNLGRMRLSIVTSATKLLEVPDFIDLSQAEVIDFRADTQLNNGHTHIARVEAPSRDKLDTLVDLLRSLPVDDKVIVFVNHRESAERVFQRLEREHLPAGLYHGGLDQQQREMALRLLDNGTTPILVSTDLASRGLDLDNVGAVVHYHLPPTGDNWTHRNGRTARMGADGLVYIITSESDNIPDYVVWDADYVPRPKNDPSSRPAWKTLYFGAGKKDKISRGDIAGFLMQQGNLSREQVGKIDLGDHYALAAIAYDRADEVLKTVAPLKIKNRKVRISLVK